MLNQQYSLSFQKKPLQGHLSHLTSQLLEVYFHYLSLRIELSTSTTIPQVQQYNSGKSDANMNDT